MGQSCPSSRPATNGCLLLDENQEAYDTIGTAFYARCDAKCKPGEKRCNCRSKWTKKEMDETTPSGAKMPNGGHPQPSCGMKIAVAQERCKLHYPQNSKLHSAAEKAYNKPFEKAKTEKVL